MGHKITEIDYIKANRKASRDEEISLYGKQISNRKMIHKSKKNNIIERGTEKSLYFVYK